MKCSQCATDLAADSWSCPRCGRPVSQRPEVVRLDFLSRPLHVLGWLLLFALVDLKLTTPLVHLRILSVDLTLLWVARLSPAWKLIWLLALAIAIAGVWVFAAACRWFCRCLRFSDGASATFSGRAEQILGWWILWVLAGRGWYLPQPWDWRLEIGLYFLGVWAALQMARWFASHVELSTARRFSFLGGYRELLGWEILLALSVLTVIGWAWVLAAMYRWMARHTRAADGALRFHALGGDILVRTVAAIVLSIPLVTIPWVWLWYTRWMVQSVTFEGDVVSAAGRVSAREAC